MNIVPIDSAKPVPGSPLDFALRYAALGWHIFPVWGAQNGKCKCRRLCNSPAKHPVSHIVPRGQDDATTDEATIRRWYNQMPDAGVAVFLKPSGMVAIDIDPRNGGFETMDDIEARNGPLSSDVLQYTQAGGEHRLFKLAADNEIALPGKLGPGVDVKRNGYIVLAPTHGASGIYDWEASSDPLEGAIPSPLPDWLRNLAVAPAIAQEGPRIISSRFASHEQLEELRSAMAGIPSDDRDLWVKFGLALCPIGQAGFDLWREWSIKSEKFDPVDLIRVWRSFKPGQFNFESIFWLAQENGWNNPLSNAVRETAPVPVDSIQIAAVPVKTIAPVSMHRIPGVLGEACDWINGTARKPQPQFAVQAALAFGATVLGRRFVTDHRNWPSMFFLNIGKSASGKEHGKWAVEHLLQACGLEHLIGPNGYTSDAGLLSALCRQPTHFCCIDEFGKVLESAAVKNNFRSAGTLRALMEVWGRNDGAMRPQGYSTFGMSDVESKRMQERTVRNPAVTMLCMTTPETFFDAVGSAAARDGFLNRFLIVESDIGRQVGQHAAKREIPQSVIDWAAKVRQADATALVNPDVSPSMSPTPTTIPIRPEAMQRFGRFERDCVAMMDEHEQDGLAEMFGRCNEMAMKLSLIVAVSDGFQAIGAAHATWAIEYVMHYAMRTVERLKTSVADSEFEALCKQVLETIRNAGERGMSEREINKVSRRFRSLDMRGKTNVLNTLAFTEDIARVEFPSVSGRGKPRQAWVALCN